MYRNSFRLTNKEIDEAFATRQFRLVFQPKIDLAERNLVGVESFARWQHPEFGVIPPALFLPVLARQGRNQELTRFVLSEAIAQLVRWRASGDTFTVSVNVAPEELVDGSLPVSIRLALNAADVDPSRLIIDLPERGLATEPNHARDTVHALSEIGVGLALECSQEPIIDLARTDTTTLDPTLFQELKIGGRAIIQFASRIEGTGLGLMRSRLEYAGSHGMQTTAVGAETPETVSLLPSLGFDQAQGNAISPPMTPQSLADFDVSTAFARLFPEEPTSTTTKPDLEDFNAPGAATTHKEPRIQVMRGKARIELLTQGNHGATTHVVKLPTPGSVIAGERHDEATGEGRTGFMGRLQHRIARAFHIQ
ncbi:MAG: EAL domain-containing protein [Candidatus Phaeomarinobacter sp.]